MEYPLSAQWDFFRDPTLYFSLLPLNIYRYVMKNYLVDKKYPVGRNWSAPQLIQRTVHPAHYFGCLRLLQNGDFLHVSNEDFTIYRMKPTDTYPGQVLWKNTFSDECDLYSNIGYDFLTDTFYFSWYDDKFWAIPQISTCFSPEEVERKIQKIFAGDVPASFPSDVWCQPPLVGPYSSNYTPTIISVGSPRHQVKIKQNGRVVWGHEFTEFDQEPWEVVFRYYGGYLFLIYSIYPNQQLQSVMEIYQIMK